RRSPGHADQLSRPSPLPRPSMRRQRDRRDTRCCRMRRVDPPGALAILAIAAHPDDIESWCAGTLACAIEAGASARLLLVTSGEKGSQDPAATPASVALTREREAAEAARRLGIAEVAYLRYSDGEVEDTLLLRAQLVWYLRLWRPAVLFTHDPEAPFP